MVSGGTLTRAAKTHLDAADFASPGIAIAGVVEPLPASTPAGRSLLLQDANDNGLQADGTVTITEQGEGTIQLKADTPAFNPTLRTPVQVFGNLVKASRGESVLNEILGSGDASQSFQAFALRKNPLTYLNDSSAADGRRSTLEVRVNGIQWTEVASFFGKGPQDEVYIVRQDDQQKSTITFGDGTTGARLPTGINNVTATYRFGAGAAKPPAGAIGQLAKPVEGLRRVVNPVAAGGGKEGDRPQDIRKNAPNSALILGRAVSIQDFEALARQFGGVVNAHVEWAWDGIQQRAVVKVWFISDGGDIAKDLKSFLIGQADPNTPLVATAATAQTPANLVIDLEVDARSKPQTVKEQVYQTLTNSETGILALANIPIGRPLFRSRIFEAVLAVAGTKAIQSITVNGSAAPFAMVAEEGRYYNFLDTLEIKPIATAGGASR
jgi:predicted phage baseplate assembly protein